MNDSVLNDVKKILGISSDNTDFDMDLIIHINSVLFVLSQMGVCKKSDYGIYSQENKWIDIIDPQTQLNLFAVKTWTALKVRMIFDPPTSSALIEALNSSIKELEWRMYITENYVGEI